MTSPKPVAAGALARTPGVAAGAAVAAARATAVASDSARFMRRGDGARGGVAPTRRTRRGRSPDRDCRERLGRAAALGSVPTTPATDPRSGRGAFELLAA